MLTFRVHVMWLMVMVQKCFVTVLSSVFLCTHFLDSKAFLEPTFYVMYAFFHLWLTCY